MRIRLTAFLALLAAEPALSQQAPTADPPRPRIDTDTIHWAYGSFLGTGFYRLSGERSVFLFDMPFSWTWRDAEIGENGERVLGVRWEFPVTAGLHQLEQLDDIIDLDNLGTVSVTPGVRIDIPVTERWLVRGSANLGWGTETSGDSDAWMWDLELKTRYGFERAALDWGLFGEVFHAGYSPSDGNDGSLGGFGAGLDFRTPLAWRPAADWPLDLNWDVTYRWYGDALTFRNVVGGETRIDDEWRFSVGLSRRDQRFRFWLFGFDQLGIGYRFSSGGDFRGVTLNFSAPLGR